VFLISLISGCSDVNAHKNDKTDMIAKNGYIYYNNKIYNQETIVTIEMGGSSIRVTFSNHYANLILHNITLEEFLSIVEEARKQRSKIQKNLK
jgi:hypothetical protein